jgi:hypothetical protein
VLLQVLHVLCIGIDTEVPMAVKYLPHHLVCRYQHLERISDYNFSFSALKFEVAGCFEMLVPVYQTASYYIPED